MQAYIAASIYATAHARAAFADLKVDMACLRPHYQAVLAGDVCILSEVFWTSLAASWTYLSISSRKRGLLLLISFQ
jgi:hypothetical protein